MSKSDFSGLENLIGGLNKMQGSGAQQVVNDVLNEAADVLIADTKKNTPVKTGHLRRSWNRTPVQSNSDGASVTISNPADYASYVEYGHRTKGGGGWVEGRFMFTNAAEKMNNGKMKRIAAKHIRKRNEEIFGK